MTRRGPSYELDAEMGDDTYKVTVSPACGKPVTIYVQRATTERSTNSKMWGYRKIPETTFLTKAGPSSGSYFTAYRSFESAVIGANVRARRIGRAFSKPLPTLKERVSA